jgi:hypothetical protein
MQGSNHTVSGEKPGSDPNKRASEPGPMSVLDTGMTSTGKLWQDNWW